MLLLICSNHVDCRLNITCGIFYNSDIKEASCAQHRESTSSTLLPIDRAGSRQMQPRRPPSAIPTLTTCTFSRLSFAVWCKLISPEDLVPNIRTGFKMLESRFSRNLDLVAAFHISH